MSYSGASLLCSTAIYIAIITAAAVVAVKIVDVFNHKKEGSK